jgi:hypothetical protein
MEGKGGGRESKTTSVPGESDLGAYPKQDTATSTAKLTDSYTSHRPPSEPLPAGQESTGKHLTTLETKWQDLIASTVQLEMAGRAAELEIQVLKVKEEALERDLEGRT